MNSEVLTIIGVGIALGLFIWRVTSRLDGRIDRLEGGMDLSTAGLKQELHTLAREFSELRGEIRGSLHRGASVVS